MCSLWRDTDSFIHSAERHLGARLCSVLSHSTSSVNSSCDMAQVVPATGQELNNCLILLLLSRRFTYLEFSMKIVLKQGFFII